MLCRPQLWLRALVLATTAHCFESVPTDYVPAIAGPWNAEITSQPMARSHQRDLGFEPLNKLFARQQANSVTCGWYSANPTLPITCNAGSACAYWSTQTPGNWACCTTSANGQFIQSACPYQSTCINAGAAGNHNTGTAGAYSSYTLACASALPACATILLNGPNGVRESHWFCTSSSAIWTAFQTTTSPSTVVNTVQTTIRSTISATIPTTITSAVTTAVTSAVTITLPDTSSIPVSTVNQTVTQTFSAASTQTGTIATPVILASPASSGGGNAVSQADVSSKTSETSSPGGTTSAASATSTGSHMNVGAVAGGTVGGVAVLALIGAAIGVLIRRKKNQRVAPVREVSQMH